MAPLTRQQASTPANNAQDTTQSLPVFEPPEPTSSPSHEDDLPMTRRDVTAMIHHSNEDLIRRINDDFDRRTNTILDEAFRRFNNLRHQSKPIGHTHKPTPEPSVEPPCQPISTTSIQSISTTSIQPIQAFTPIRHTSMDVIESSTNHVTKSSTKQVAVARNVTATTPRTHIHTYAVPTSLTQAKSTANPAPTTRRVPHTHTTRFVFDPGGKHCNFITVQIHHTLQMHLILRIHLTRMRIKHLNIDHQTHHITLQRRRQTSLKTSLHITAIQNEPVDKPRAYNVAEDDAEDVTDKAYEAYYYDPPNDAYKSVAKCPRCRFHFDSYDKLIEHMTREGHEA